MRNFNPWICQFDVLLHTFDHVRERSSLLFTVILAAAARAFNTSLRNPLQAHARDLLSRSLLNGPRSVELAHAILVTTSWKEPEDTSTWMLIGHAIRMGYELGWHKLQLREVKPGETPPEVRRAQRDIERVWLLLFVCDRNLSFQTGNPWMIERSDFFLKAREKWYRDSLATENDQMLCSLVDLRLLTSDTFRPSHPRHRGQGSDGASQFDQRGSLVRIILHDIDQWQSQWSRTNAIASNSCHISLLRLYGAHLRLLLASSPLEASLASASALRSIDKRALWLSFSSAVDLLNVVADPHIRTSLYFAYDSIHVETAYSAIFLVKLCLLLPLKMSSELEITAQKSLQNTMKAFEQQAAPSNTVCALQAKFLGNILSVFQHAMRSRHIADRDKLALRDTPVQGSRHPEASGVRYEMELNNHLATEAQDTIVPLACSGAQVSRFGGGYNSHERTTQKAPQQSDLVLGAANSSMPNQGSWVGSLGPGPNWSSTVSLWEPEPVRAIPEASIFSAGSPETCDANFSRPDLTDSDSWRVPEETNQSFVDVDDVFPDDDMWATMFTNVGFSIDHGTFTNVLGKL